MQVWDTAGQERFRTITTAYYRTAHGILLVYDVTKPGSFESLSHWAEQIDLHASDSVIRYLVGNKTDLTSVVTQDKVNAFASKLGVKSFYTSAKSGAGIDQMFTTLAQDIQRNIDKMEKQSKGLDLDSQQSQSPGCCGGGDKK